MLFADFPNSNFGFLEFVSSYTLLVTPANKQSLFVAIRDLFHRIGLVHFIALCSHFYTGH